MDDAKNFVLSMMNTVKERIGNPFIGAFATAWFIWNFKIVLVVLSKGEGGWKAKIQYIFIELMPTKLDWFFHGYLVPAAAASIWIFALPPVLRKIAVWHEEQENLTRKDIYKASEKRILTKEDEIALRAHIVEERLKISSERENILKSLEDGTKREERLVSELNDAKVKINYLSIETNELKNKSELDKLQIESLNNHINPPEIIIDNSKFSDQSYINGLLSEIGFEFESNNTSISNFIFQSNPAVIFPSLVKRVISFDGFKIFRKNQIIEESYACILLLISEKYKINHIPYGSEGIKISSKEFYSIFPLGLGFVRDEVIKKLISNDYISKFTTGNINVVIIKGKAIRAGQFFKMAGFTLKLPETNEK